MRAKVKPNTVIGQGQKAYHRLRGSCRIELTSAHLDADMRAKVKPNTMIVPGQELIEGKLHYLIFYTYVLCSLDW